MPAGAFVRHRHWFALALIAAGVATFVTLALDRGWLQEQELLAYDGLLALRGADAAGSDSVVIVQADDADILKWGWPLPDGVLAEVLARLTGAGVTAVAVDLYRDIAYPPGSEQLDRMLRAHPNILMVTKLPNDGQAGIPGPAVLADAPERIGFADMVLDPGGVVRRGALFIDVDGEVQTAIALLAALQHLGTLGIAAQPDAANPDHLRLGATTIVPLEGDEGGYAGADAGGYQFMLDYRRGHAPFPRLSISTLLENPPPEALLRGRIALVGVAADSVKDIFSTPFSRAAGAQEFGVVLHGAIADQLVRAATGAGGMLRTPSPALEWLLAALAGWAALALGWAWRGSAGLALVALGLLAAVWGGAWAALVRASIWLPVVAPSYAIVLAALLITAYASRFEMGQKDVAMKLFSRYVSKEVAQELWLRRGQYLGAGGRPRPRRLPVSVLFSDIAGFTTIAESLDPERLALWLDRYLNEMAGLVTRHGGVVDKFIGDAVMAVFGVPLESATEAARARDARNAVACALAMGEALATLNREFAAADLPRIRIRIGVHSGPVMAGSFGSDERLEYTVIGDTVNVAARLEGYGKNVDGGAAECAILIGEPTRRLLPEGLATEYVGDVTLKGKEQPMPVYKVAAVTDAVLAPGQNAPAIVKENFHV